MSTVTILRGIPGAGKSFYAHRELGGVVVNTDDYFISDMQYKFDPKKIPLAHAWCFDLFTNYLIDSFRPHIVVDNTNIHTWEWIRYYKTAVIAKCPVRIIEFMPSTIEELRICAQRCIHEVPYDVIGRMAIEFEAVDSIQFSGVEVVRYSIYGNKLED